MAEGRRTLRVERPVSIQIDPVRPSDEGRRRLAAVLRRSPELRRGGTTAARGRRFRAAERRGERHRVQSFGEPEPSTPRGSVVTVEQAVPSPADQRQLPAPRAQSTPVAVERSDQQSESPDGARRNSTETGPGVQPDPGRPQAVLQCPGRGSHGHGDSRGRNPGLGGWIQPDVDHERPVRTGGWSGQRAVSYTHLTLPTILRV